jgi:hypothetical protein
MEADTAEEAPMEADTADEPRNCTKEELLFLEPY